MITLGIILVAIAVYLYFYATRPTFKAWTNKVFVWIVAAVAAVGAAIAAWFNQLPSVGV